MNDHPLQRRLLDVAIVALSLLSLLMAAAMYRADVEARKPVREFTRRFGLEKRRPEVVRTLELAPSADWATEIVADTVLRDAYANVDLTNASPEVREAWIAAVQSTDSELKTSQSALLDALSRSVGWPFYQSLLGQTTFTIQSRALDPDLVKNSAKWSRPLLNAARSAPASHSIWQSLAVGYLQTWPVLERTHAANADEVFSRAFSQSHFVVDAFGPADRLLGTERATRYLPSSPRPLRVAFEHYSRTDAIDPAWRIFRKWEHTEWRDRGQDLIALEGQSTPDLVAASIDLWLGTHSIWQFDSPAAHAQAARLLAMSLRKPRGAWQSDPLAEVVRYLLSRPPSPETNARAIARSLEMFFQVPPAILAEVKVLSGDLDGGQRLAATNETDSEEWSRYRLAVARHANTPRAQRVGFSSPAGADERQCGVVRLPFAPDDHNRVASLRVETNAPAILELSVNGARSSTNLVDGALDVSFVLPAWREMTITSTPVSGDRNPCLTLKSLTAAR